MAVGSRLLRERDIQVYASLILGYPGETQETIANTLDVLAECDFEHLILHVLHVVPGSPLWHRRAEYGLEVNRQGFWSHRTMSLREMPEIVRSTYVGADAADPLDDQQHHPELHQPVLRRRAQPAPAGGGHAHPPGDPRQRVGA